MKSFFIPVSLLSVALAACSSPAGSSDPSAEDLSALQIANDQRAKCQIFVNQVSVLKQHNDVGGAAPAFAKFYIKTPRGSFKGKPTQVGFYGRVTSDAGQKQGPAPLNQWEVVTTAISFPGATGADGYTDYWQLTLATEQAALGNYRYEGSFFVQTDDGTKYWANADSKGTNFVIDADMTENIVQIYGRSFGIDREGTRLEASSQFKYLNPNSCK